MSIWVIALVWQTGRIHLEAADADLLQVKHQGIELTKDPDLLAAQGGQGAFGQF